MKIISVRESHNIENRQCNCRRNPSMQGFRQVPYNISENSAGKNIFTRLKSSFKNYSARINYTWQHKKAFLKVEKELYGKNSLGGYLHDVDKLIMYIIGIPGEIAQKIHVATAPHHIRNGKIKKPEMAIIDWESARLTKPDKQLSCREFYEKKCPKIPEIEILMDKYGL